MSDNRRPHEFNALFWGALAKVADGEKDIEKSLCASNYDNGEGKYFRTPTGLKLGQVRRDDPDPGWKFTDRAAFEAHVRANHPGVVETRLEIVPGHDAEVLAVLAEHAEHLLREVEYVPDEVFADALKHSHEAGKAAGPGIEWYQPTGRFGVYPDKAAVEFLRQSMRVELDSLFPKEIPAAAEDERKTA